MQRERPTLICKNPLCNKEITTYKSSKREYCDNKNQCKNEANYIKNETKNELRNAHIKELKKAEKLIDFLLDTGKPEFSFDLLNEVNFNFNLLYGKDTLPDGTIIMKLGKYQVQQNSAKTEIYQFLEI